MLDLAIVRAPHQVLYSAEKLIGSTLKKVIVLDMFNFANVNNTVNEALKFGKWDIVIKLNYSTKGVVGICKYLAYLCCLKVLSLIRVRIDNLIIGDGDIIFGKVIADNFKYVNRVVVIGDGNDFIRKSDSTDYISYPCNVGNKMQLVLKMLRFKFDRNHRFDELFTFYKVGDPRLVNNELSYLKKLALQAHFTSDSENAYFLGSPLLGVLDRQSLKKVYKRVFSSFPGSTIYYLPHRRETQEQISIVKPFEGVRIVKNIEGIIETFFLSKGIIPSQLGSFVSNACFSLAAIYPQIRINMFGLDFSGEEPPESDIRLFSYLKNDLKDDRIEFNEIKVSRPLRASCRSRIRYLKTNVLNSCYGE